MAEATIYDFADPPRILFADDDEDGVLEVCRYYVEQFGWQADYVTTARQIIAKVNENCGQGGRCYDALVCDVNYFDRHPEEGPRITGITAVRQVQAAHPDLPVIFMTGYVSLFVTDEIKKLGAEYMAKPVDYERLFARIAYLIKWRAMTKPALDRASEPITEDRRRASINRSGQLRRSTDKLVELPAVLDNILAEVKEERREYVELRVRAANGESRDH